MTSKELLKKYIDFFKEKGHSQIPSVSLVPENDPTLLFVNSGMFPLVPYLSGEKHPLGNRLVNVQRCLRFEDLEEVGNSNRHTIAFHMIGNWSLGDYFKKEQLHWIYDFYVNELGLDINKIYATVFKGNKDAPKDETSIAILKEVFASYGVDAKENERIFAFGKKDNWWQRGDAIGELGGPDSEAFYYIGKEGDGFGKNPTEHEDEFIEIGNSVFMQYKKTEFGWEELPQKNVDYGGGLERLALAVQNKQDIFETDNFWPLIQKIEEISGKEYRKNEKVTESMRILADHIRAATFLAMDGVAPTNKDQGYILRRIIRRMVRAGRNLNITEQIATSLVPTVIETFSWLYEDLPQKQNSIIEVFAQEEDKFRKTLIQGIKKSNKNIDKLLRLQELSKDFKNTAISLASGMAYEQYQSLGYPPEMFVEDLKESNVHIENYEELETNIIELMKAHKKQSQIGAEQKFKGGLADTSETTIKYHTTTHLLHWALRKVLGKHVQQKGSNITDKRLRFDFSHDGKLNSDEVLEVETLINEKIGEKLPVNFVELPKDEAIETGALHFFGDAYGDKVKVYYIGDSLESAFSKEFCGGPHVKNTAELSDIEIFKQDSLGHGVVRVYVRFVK